MLWAAGSAGNGAGGEEPKPKRKIKVTVPKWCGKWVVSMDEFEDGVVGAKSKNLAGSCKAGVLAVLLLLGRFQVLLPSSLTACKGGCTRVACMPAFQDQLPGCQREVGKLPGQHPDMLRWLRVQGCAASCPSPSRCRRQ